MKNMLFAAFLAASIAVFGQSDIEFSQRYHSKVGEGATLTSVNGQVLIQREADLFSIQLLSKRNESFLLDSTTLLSPVEVDDCDAFQFGDEDCSYLGYGKLENKLYYFFTLEDEMTEKVESRRGSISVIGAEVLSNGHYSNPTVVAKVPVMYDGEQLISPVVRKFENSFILFALYGDMNEQAILTGESPDLEELKAVVYIPMAANPMRFIEVESRIVNQLGNFNFVSTTDSEAISYSIGPAEDLGQAWFGTMFDAKIKVCMSDLINANVLEIEADVENVQMSFEELDSWSYVNDSTLRIAFLGVVNDVAGVYYQTVDLSSFEFTSAQFFGFSSRFNQGDELEYNPSIITKHGLRMNVAGYNHHLADVLFRPDGGSYIIWESFGNIDDDDFEFRNIIIESISKEGQKEWTKVVSRLHTDMPAFVSQVLPVLSGDELHLFYFDHLSNLEVLRSSNFEEVVKVEELDDTDDGVLFHLEVSSSGDSVKAERVGDYSGDGEMIPNFGSSVYDEENRMIYTNFQTWIENYVAVIAF